MPTETKLADPKAVYRKDMTAREIEALARTMCDYPDIRAPVQGFPSGIPWEMHMRAYEAYVKRWAPQVALIDLYGRGCRGGFGVGELDGFIPGWRDELSERTRLIKEIDELKAALNQRTAKTYADGLEDAAKVANDLRAKYLEELEKSVTDAATTGYDMAQAALAGAAYSIRKLAEGDV